MKHIILIVSLLMGVTLGVQAQPKALFDKATHEFGTILWKNPVTATFKITNKGDKPLVISNVTTLVAARLLIGPKNRLPRERPGLSVLLLTPKPSDVFRRA